MKYMGIFSALILALLLAAAAGLCIGTSVIPPGTIADVLFRGAEAGQAGTIILKIRLPRVLAAVVLGGALSLSGFLLQTYFQNPIAGPFVLGISSGAKMTVALTMVFLLNGRGITGSFLLIAAAFIGALLVTVLILLVSRRLTSMPSLLVAGIMVGYIASAATDFIITFADDADIANLHGWTKGSFAAMNLDSCAICAGVVGFVFLLVLLLSKPIAAYQLGEPYARSMGVNTALFRPAVIVLSSVLSACVTAFAGPVSFVGIAVPFLVKRCFGTARPTVIIPGCFLGGALFCVLCDIAARMLFAPLELSISTVTSVIGAPVVIYMLMRRSR